MKIGPLVITRRLYACILFLLYLSCRICGKRNKEGQHPNSWHRREPRSPFPKRHDRPGGDCSLFLAKINRELCRLLRSFAEPFVLLPTGHVWEAREWAEGNKHQPRGPKEELPGIDWAQTHPASHAAVFWWGQLDCAHCLQPCGGPKEKWEFCFIVVYCRGFIIWEHIN